MVAAATFLLAFAVADVTGVRPLGGLVLFAGGAWCARAAHAVAGTTRTSALLVFALGAFVVSHLLGDLIGAWPAVVVVSAAVALAAAALTALRPATTV